MKTNRILGGVSILAVFLVLISCSSGSTANSGGGVGGSGIVSRGTISEFGSIIVNGTRFDTTTAVVVIDGEDMGIGDTVIYESLDIGQVVTVQGMTVDSEDNDVAVSVIYQRNVKGPVSHVDDSDPDTLVLTVMGQTVMVNYLTKYKNTTFEEISPGDVVEISGFYDNEGTIWATFLGNIGTFDEEVIYEVKGFVNSLDLQQKTFMINGLQVDFAIADTSGLPGEQPIDGLLVETEGTVDHAFTHMSASSVRKEDEIGAENAEEVEITGFVTYFIDVDEFIVGNQVVIIEDGAVFIDGLPGDVGPGVKLEAEGELRDGILWAYEIEFWEPDQFEIEGPVTNIKSMDIVKLESEFTVGDQVVVTIPTTLFEDGELTDIDYYVNVEIKGRMQNDIMIADKVSFELGGI